MELVELIAKLEERKSREQVIPDPHDRRGADLTDEIISKLRNGRFHFLRYLNGLQGKSQAELNNEMHGTGFTIAVTQS